MYCAKMRGYRLLTGLTSALSGPSGRSCQTSSFASLKDVILQQSATMSSLQTPLPPMSESDNRDPPCSGVWPQQSFPNAPQLCAVPKKRVTLYRRTVRRQWYALKRKEELSRCTFCGWVSGKNQFMGGVTGNTACTGQCMRGFEQQYPTEYKPPC